MSRRPRPPNPRRRPLAADVAADLRARVEKHVDLYLPQGTWDLLELYRGWQELELERATGKTRRVATNTLIGAILEAFLLEHAEEIRRHGEHARDNALHVFIDRLRMEGAAAAASDLPDPAGGRPRRARR